MSGPPINVDDYRQLAKKRLPNVIFDYLEGGADDEKGLRHNRRVLEALRFTPRRLRDVQKRSIETRIFGQSFGAPLIVASTGLNGLLWPDGDLLLARAAAKHNIPFMLSTASNMSLEDIASRGGGEQWLQLYVVQRRLAERMVKRALHAGYTTLVLTVDVAVNGHRERDLRNGFTAPIRLTPATMIDAIKHPRWTLDYLRHGKPTLINFADAVDDIDAQAALLSRRMDASFDWEGLSWLRDLWPHRLLVKGIAHAADVAECEARGVDGVILSNHGGRQLDECVSPMEILPEVRSASRLPLLIDSGFRRGSDIVKALAIGADAVCLGRATLYGLAARGEQGVDEVIGLIKTEIDSTMAHLGCSTVEALTPDVIFNAPGNSSPLPRSEEASTRRNTGHLAAAVDSDAEL